MGLLGFCRARSWTRRFWWAPSNPEYSVISLVPPGPLLPRVCCRTGLFVPGQQVWRDPGPCAHNPLCRVTKGLVTPGEIQRKYGRADLFAFPPSTPRPHFFYFLFLSLFSCVPELCSFAVAGFVGVQQDVNKPRLCVTADAGHL